MGDVGLRVRDPANRPPALEELHRTLKLYQLFREPPIPMLQAEDRTLGVQETPDPAHTLPGFVLGVHTSP